MTTTHHISMQKTLLELFNLSKNFGSIKAVDGLSLSLKKGNVYGLLGPNGSGKSTTLGMVLNVVNPTSGYFQWYSGTITTHQALKKIGAIIERPNFYPYMTALQNMVLLCKIKECDTNGIEEKLKLVGLWERRNSKFSTFSLGMKQRLAIAAALINNPELLILDEPTNGLDPEGIHHIRKLILNIAKMGTTILLASHLLDEVEKVCSHVIVLKKGVKYYEGPVDQITVAHGFFEIKCTPIEAAIHFLESLSDISEIQNEQDLIRVFPKNDMKPESLSKKLAEAKIYPTHFVWRKPTLEDQFLSLTQT
ncbi:MAG: ATP-binding cassette domain-containing protein [Flavobacteriaceae bacterium]